MVEGVRSSLAKVAMMTLADMFRFLRRCMESYLDPIVKVLLKKSAEMSSGFISEEADKALLCMTTHC